MLYIFNIYNKVINYMKKKTKVVIPISLNKELSNLIKESITNRSKYIEWLIYQDMINSKVDGIEKIIL